MRPLLFLILFAVSCKHQPSPCDLPTNPLDEIMPGKWILTEVKGWPHSSDKFVAVSKKATERKLLISENHTLQQSGDPKVYTYKLKTLDKEIVFCPSYNPDGWIITDFDNCMLVFRQDGNDEGPFWTKYIREEE